MNPPHRPHMRPEFTVTLDGDGQAVLDRIGRELDQTDLIVGQVVTGHAMLELPRGRRSLLSPVLNLELVERGGRPALRGRFSPQPNVWTGFMAVYGVLALVGLAGLMYGFAQLTVDETPWSMLAAPACLAVAGFVYGAAFIGQGLTVDEMYELRVFVTDVVRERPG